LSLRSIPGLTVLRPADANETAAAWQVAISLNGPVALALTRQKLPTLDYRRYPIYEGVPRGAYVLSDAEGGKPDIILVATGSEVALIIAAAEKLAATGIRARVVSMPSWELFDEQPAEYRGAVFPRDIPMLAVEAAVPIGWYKYLQGRGDVIGLNRFGASAPGETVMKNLGFTVEHVVEKSRQSLEKK
jgi:transketolase